MPVKILSIVMDLNILSRAYLHAVPLYAQSESSEPLDDDTNNDHGGDNIAAISMAISTALPRA
jgi:hypothetical protein